MPGTLHVDGVDIATHGATVLEGATLWAVPGPRGTNVEVPARHGALFTAGKKFGANELALPMLVEPGDGDLHDRVDKLTRLFTKRTALLHLEWTPPSGPPTRETLAECLSPFVVAPQGFTSALMTVEMNVPPAFWRDTSDSTFTSAAGLADEQKLAVPEMVGATAPMDDWIYVITGPGDNVELTVFKTGAFVRYEGNLAPATTSAGPEQVRIDADRWTAVKGRDIGWTGSGTNVIGDTVHGGSARLVDVPPPESGDTVLVFGGQNLGADTQLEARGRRKYLLG